MQMSPGPVYVSLWELGLGKWVQEITDILATANAVSHKVLGLSLGCPQYSASIRDTVAG